MKRFITAMIVSVIMLVGCAGPNDDVSQIREGDYETFWQGLTYDAEQKDAILFSDLEKEFQKSNMNVIKDTHPDALTGQYNLEDEQVSITILVDELISPGHQLISNISIEPLNNDMLLSEHPAMNVIARVMGEEGLLTWVAERESETIQASKDRRNIQDVLAIDRCYLSFEYWPGSSMGRLDFRWAFEPSISAAFEKIAPQLEENGMLTTGYIAGAGGETLIATNINYYKLRKVNYFKDEKIPVDVDQVAAYQVMHDINKPDNYSVQLYGYMRGDLAYPTKVGAMPGLDRITQLMNMERDEFLAITDEINEELTEAKRIRNNIYRGEYYVEGEVGGYRYVITVPAGDVLYNFTVLMEKI